MASTLQRVLELWRASERELAAQTPERRDGTSLASQIDRLRRLYQTITVHERRELRALRDSDRTIVRSEWLTLRSRAATELAEDAVARARRTRLGVGPAASSGPQEPATAPPTADERQPVSANRL